VTSRVRLLNPGPVTLTERVRRALLSRDLCHREPAFAELQAEVCDRLEKVYDRAAQTHTAVLLTGSGTAAVEAMLGSLVPQTGAALVVENGAYGERMSAMLRALGRSVVTVSSGWTDPMDLEGVERALDAEPGTSHVVAVHHETTTGRLNDIPSLGRICRDRDVPLLLDAVSSFGGEPLDLEAWNVEACASTANKCLHGVPGIAFVLARRSAFETRSTAASSLYLDLFRYYRAQQSGSPPFTPAVQSLFALRAALVELEEAGGWQARHQHYQDLSIRVRKGLHELGVGLLLGREQPYCSMLTSFNLPAGLPFDHLFERAAAGGFVIYPGQQSLMDAIFRIAVMGDLSAADIDEFIELFATILHGA